MESQQRLISFGSRFDADPRVLNFAEHMGIPVKQAIGELFLFYRTAADFSFSGDLSTFDVPAFERACGWTGEEGVLWAALQDAGVITPEFRVAQWDQHFTMYSNKVRRQKYLEAAKAAKAAKVGEASK